MSLCFTLVNQLNEMHKYLCKKFGVVAPLSFIVDIRSSYHTVQKSTPGRWYLENTCYLTFCTSLVDTSTPKALLNTRAKFMHLNA